MKTSTVIGGIVVAALTLSAPLSSVSAQTVGGTDGGAVPLSTAPSMRAFDLQKYLSAEGQARMQRLHQRWSARQTGDNTAAATINFDDAVAPCFFVETAPLRGAQQGAFFFGGNQGLDGGAILDTCSNFGIEPASPPNFLAFNSEAPYTTGGVPKLPEFALFFPQSQSVSMKVSSGGSEPGAVVVVLAGGPGGVQDFKFVALDDTWQSVTVNGTISWVLLLGNINWLVVDDVVAN